MPKVSKETVANVDDHGIVEDHHEDFDGHTIQFLSFRQDADGTPLMKVFPTTWATPRTGATCSSARITVRFADHEEVVEAGDAFYLPPGHIPSSRRARSTSSSGRASNCTRSLR